MKVLREWKENAPVRSRGVRITVSTSCFVPKPHTPFQWEPQVTMEEYLRRVKLLRDTMTSRAITYHWHEADTSYIEAVLSRGDRRLGGVLEDVWRSGGRMESWSEGFSLERWETALAGRGLTGAFYANRPRSREEVLPWSRVDMGCTPEHLWRERERCYASQLSPDCRAACSGCGAAKFLGKGEKCDA